VTVLEALAKFPQASIEVNVLVCERLHPLKTTAPVVVTSVGAAHPSNAEAIPSAALISSGSGLQPRFPDPLMVNTGGVLSVNQFTVLDAVDILPQASMAVNVLVCVRSHPLLTTAPSDDTSIGAPQASVAVATPSAAVIENAGGLQPRFNEPPLMVNKGGVKSVNQFTVLDAVDILPQASMAVNVLVCERSHPLITTGPVVVVNAGEPQSSDALAVPRAAAISFAEGLQPSPDDPVLVITNVGGLKSEVQNTILITLEVFPQASTAVNRLVIELLHPRIIGPSVAVIVGVLQASVAVAVPNRSNIILKLGLQLRRVIGT
jgi:hypothetical protein